MLDFIESEFDDRFATLIRPAMTRRYVVSSDSHARFVNDLQRLRSVNPRTVYDSHWRSHLRTLASLAYSAGELTLYGQRFLTLDQELLTNVALDTDGYDFDEFLMATGMRTAVNVYTHDLQLCYDIYHGDQDACLRCPELVRVMDIVGYALHLIWEGQNEAERKWADANERRAFIKLKLCRRKKRNYPVSLKDQCDRLAKPAEFVNKIDRFTTEQAAIVHNIKPEVMESLLTENATPSAIAELVRKTGYVSRSWRSRNFVPVTDSSTASAASTGTTLRPSADPKKVDDEFDRHEGKITYIDDHRPKKDDKK